VAALSAHLPGGRLHLQHGPIDVVIECWGERAQVRAAYECARLHFQDLLETLVAELPLLRTAIADPCPLARGPVARRMIAAVWPHREVFVTPMAAVAGAVADEILAAMLSQAQLERAFVNDGGDIAIHAAPGEHLEAGIVENPARPQIVSTLRIERSSGVATSGWRGRSQSLGIADAVTVLAHDAAAADAAATLIANAVNAEHAAIERRPARSVKEDSDLGDLPVTVRVGDLPHEVVREALESGLAEATRMRSRGLIEAAYLALQGERRVAAPPQQGECGKLRAQRQIA